MRGPCEWTLDDTPLVTNQFWNDLDVSRRDAALEFAKEFLWRWTGEQFGLCLDTIRPCQEGFSTVPHRVSNSYDFAVVRPPHRGAWISVEVGGESCAVMCGSCYGDCACIDYPGLRLPALVHEVVKVVEDGVELPTESWQFRGGVLYRLDGLTWRTHQDLLKPATEPGTWEITVKFGTPVPPGGRVALAVLAEQIARAMMGANGCNLPQRLRSVTREGVTMTAYDSFEDLSRGGTGLWLVDSWVASINKTVRPSAVFSPDYCRPGGGFRV